MTPAERTAKITEPRAEADRLEREGKRSWPEKVEAGDCFKAPDAPEPTGVDLVGRVCQLSLYPIKDNSDGIRDTVVMYDAKHHEYHGDGGQDRPWKYARLYREDRP